MVDVLLATHKPNPRWLKEQVESIRAQTNVEVNLVCREDAEGLGARGSFDLLLRESNADYAAFSDQDDVWCPDKLSKCLAEMKRLEEKHGKDTPLVVFCDGWVTDAALNRKPGTILSRQWIDVKRGLAFNRLLMQNFIPGNAMLFNAALRDRAGRVPEGAIMHDIWLALAAAAFGHIGFVNEPLYLYRQHGDNVLGVTEAGVRLFWARTQEGVAAFRDRIAANAREARAFAERFGLAAPAAARALAELPSGGWLKRRGLILQYGLWKQGVARNLSLLLFA